MKFLIITLLFLHKIESAIEYMSCQRIKELGMCYDKVNKNIICNACYTLCGFQYSNYCNDNNTSESTNDCIDKMDCSTYQHLCNVPSLIESLKGICDKTCNYCKDSKPSPDTSKVTNKPSTTTTHTINIHQKDMCLSLRD
uniref:ShKT domain-containing protein n=1 Tax=Strongyloides stercoralis TaxID=6248 RepID=A0AAF5D9E1_STRER